MEKTKKKNQISKLLLPLIIVLLMVIVAFGGNALGVSPYYVYGVETGIVVGLLVVLWRLKAEYTADERYEFIFHKSASISFFICILITAVFSFISRSSIIQLTISYDELSTLMISIMYIIFMINFLVISKKY